MTFHIITLFPQMFEGVFASSIVKRAQDQNKIKINLLNLRDFGQGRHQTVDDKPYGGGAGMVLKPDVLAQAVQKAKGKKQKAKSLTVLTSPSGTPYTQSKTQEFSQLDDLIIICGHYEGVDQRFIDKYVDEEISIGDFVLTGGEIPAMVIIDSITRLLPGVIKSASLQSESFSNYTLYPKPYTLLSTLLEHPHYTRPELFERKRVPQVLLSGNHRQIAEWRHQKSLSKTKKVRPDLLS